MANLIDPKNKILRHPDVLERFRRGEKLTPINVEFDLSNACNLGCKHCAFGYTHNNVIMSTQLAIRILKELRDVGVKSITFSGGGEPTTHPDFEDIATVAKGLGFDLGIYTNGVRIKELSEVIPLFKWIYVSLDAANRTAYYESKKRDLFNRVVDNITLLAANSGATTIGIGFLLDKDNYTVVNQMVRIIRETKADYGQFRPIVGLDSYRWVNDALHILSAFSGDNRVVVNRQRFMELRAVEVGAGERGYNDCWGSELVPCIGADGKLWVCPNTRGKRELGDLKKDSFDSIWERRPAQLVGDDCRVACRNHNLNTTLEYIKNSNDHDNFV